MKAHKVIIEFQTPDLPKEYERKLYAQAKILVDDFRATIADLLTEAGVEATVVSHGTVSRDN